MKMLIVKESKEFPEGTKRVGTVKSLCNSCGKKTVHLLYEFKEKSFIKCECGERWEVTFYNATGTA